MLLENVRKGFFELDQFTLLLKYLPEEYHALYEVAYITGWRIRSELLTRQWRHLWPRRPRSTSRLTGRCT